MRASKNRYIAAKNHAGIRPVMKKKFLRKTYIVTDRHGVDHSFRSEVEAKVFYRKAREYWAQAFECALELAR